MDRRLKSITFLVLLLLLFLTCFFSCMGCVSEARPSDDSLPEKDVIREVNGIFRTLKNSGPSPGGGGHRLKRLENFGGMKDSGPSSGGGHRVKTAQDAGMMKKSGPSPGEGHKYITGNNS